MTLVVARVCGLAVRSGFQCRARAQQIGVKQNPVGTGRRVCGVSAIWRACGGRECFGEPVKRPGATIHAGEHDNKALGEMLNKLIPAGAGTPHKF